MLVRPPGNCPTCPCVQTALISGAYEEGIMCISLLFHVCVGAECKKKKQPPLPHTHTFVAVEDEPLSLAKKIETAEIFVWKQNIYSESQGVLLVSFVNLPPHILVASWSFPFMSTLKACSPLSGPFLYLCIWTIQLHNS